MKALIFSFFTENVTESFSKSQYQNLFTLIKQATILAQLYLGTLVLLEHLKQQRPILRRIQFCLPNEFISLANVNTFYMFSFILLIMLTTKYRLKIKY